MYDEFGQKQYIVGAVSKQRENYLYVNSFQLNLQMHFFILLNHVCLKFNLQIQLLCVSLLDCTKGNIYFKILTLVKNIDNIELSIPIKLSRYIQPFSSK